MPGYFARATSLEALSISPRPRFTVRILSSSEASLLAAAQRLRAEVFVRELSWVPGCGCGREHDRCDGVATHLVVLASEPIERVGAKVTGNRVAGYARILLPEHTFMLEREFAALLPDGRLIRESARSFEVSRFVVHPDLRGRLDIGGRSAAEHLQLGIARWALARGYSDLYSVCEARHIRALRLRAFPVRQFGRIVEYMPGVRACAIHLDLGAAHKELRTRRHHDYQWYMQGVARW